MISDIEVWHESLALRSSFRISRGVRDTAEVLVARASRSGIFGYGESVPYGRYGESIAGCLESARLFCDGGVISRESLQVSLPAGALRNAIDCALWDLESRLLGCSVADLAGVILPSEVVSAYTISGESPDDCIRSSLLHCDKSILKMKLMGDGFDELRVRGVRGVRSDVCLIVDANESWDCDIYLSMLDVLVDCKVSLLEQPFASGSDFILSDLPRPIAVCADESCLVLGDLESGGLVGLYDVVNIKLDKAGGLTHGLAMKARALELGFGVMIGCMVGSSLSMRAGLVLCGGDAVDWVDLDGALWLREDRVGGLNYIGNRIII